MAQSVANIGIKGFRSQGSTNLEIEGLDELVKRLEYIESKSPNMKLAITKIIRIVMAKATKEVMEGAKDVLPNDPGQAYRAVRSLLYKRIYGANINILTGKRKRQAQAIPESPTQTGRGGNRRKRSANTIRMMGYWGEDRGFILRWINDGTKMRYISTDNNTKVNKSIGRGRTSESVSDSRNGNRGMITGQHWFKDTSMQAMYDASARITALIDETITEIWGADALSGLTGTTTHNTI